ncbi:YncE family protein [Robertmurraya sp. GLU-23]
MKRSLINISFLLIIFAIFLTGCSSNTNGNEGKTSTDAEKNTEQPKEIKENNKEIFYFTANEGGSINKIRVADNEVVSTIEVDGAVHNIQTSPNGEVFAVTLVPTAEGGHGDMEMPGFVLFYNSQTNELQNKVEVGNHPAHVVFTDDGRYGLVTNNEDNTVSVIDLSTYTVINTISTGEGPHGFRTSKDNQYAYVANMGEDTVSVINIETMKEEKRITVGETPVTTGITSDGKTLVATLNGENKLAIIDVETESISKVDVGVGPAQVYIDAKDQYAYVANQGTPDQPSNTISVIDIKEKKIITTIETGKGSHGVVLSSNNQFAYVTNMYENTVSIIDLETYKVTGTIQVGETPNGISIMD